MGEGEIIYMRDGGKFLLPVTKHALLHGGSSIKLAIRLMRCSRGN